ncbi:hypothetical protein JKF63_06936 [Porcisia hertigi]|uniref:Uncharacterized protein n=1 Tax=Porcisia hertigi TaxID=2761500 RepID=A0A836LJE9_9TRYP|nr:hypothetical protein JKF63_06936 [Porcisia hertigi]
MLLFRQSADMTEGNEEHHEPVKGMMEQHETVDAAAAEHETLLYEDGTDLSREASSSVDPYGDPGSASYLARESTVPPLDQVETAEDHYLDSENYLGVNGVASAPAASAPVPFDDVPALPIPRTNNSGSYAAARSNDARHNSYYTCTPRGAASSSPRSLSGISGGGIGSIHRQQYRRCSSVVMSARLLSARRASSVNGVVGIMDSCYTSVTRRNSGMTEGERLAVERMIENAYRRQEAAERAEQYALARQRTIVTGELERAKNAHQRQMRLDEELHERVEMSGRSRQERMNSAAQRRQELEKQRLRALFDTMAEKDARYSCRDPYSTMIVQRRYSSRVRNAAAIAPQRRSSPPPKSKSRGSPRASHCAGEGITKGNTDDDRALSPPTGRRSNTPRIDMSKPRQCLSLDAWKAPEKQHQTPHRNGGSDSHLRLSPKVWRTVRVVEHPHQWH